MTPADWKAVQKRLLKLGFNPGPIDGVRGRLTTNAVRRFQESRGLVADGIVGPITHAALFGKVSGGASPNYDRMPWYEEAMRLVGTREISGSKSNKVILEWADGLDIDYKDDDIPWCGLFVGHCVGSMLPDEALPSNVLGARQWSDFGEACDPQLGAVIVFWRVKKSGWKGHVGLYHSEDADTFHILGGNQSNSVNIARISKDRLLEARWPATALDPEGEVVIAAVDGDVSENEA